MNIVDLILIILLIAGAVRGFVKGFFVEFASVAAIILGVLSAIYFSGQVRGWLSGLVSWHPGTIKVVAFLLIFFSVLIVVHLIANILEKFVQAVALGILSRLGGAVFGLIKTAFILSFLMYLIARIESFDFKIIPKEEKKESKYYAPIERLAPNLFPFLKDDREETGKKSGEPDAKAL
ncbi:MAG: CvpA family protein [Marinilabiliales bacterium]|nr:CvpA family protein [Marinilabiliales bacterium]